MRIRRFLYWALALAVVAGLGWGGTALLRRRSAKPEPTVTSYVAAVERGDLVASITPTGEVYAPRAAELTVDVARLPLIEMSAVAGEQVTAGEVLARIDPSSLERAVDQARANLLTAEDALAEARNPYTDLDRQRAALNVAQATTALDEARQSLDDLQHPDLESAQEAVEEAARELDQARDDLAALKTGTATQDQVEMLEWLYNEAVASHGLLVQKHDASEQGQDSLLVAYNAMLDTREALESARVQAELSLITAENRVLEAQDSVSDAEERLAHLKAGPTSLELAQARDRIAQAEYSLTRAQEAEAEIEAGPDTNDIQSAQAAYDAAVAALQEAEARLASATIVAPFSGTVVSVGAEIGDLVSAGTVIATVADLSELRVRATIDETEIGQVEVGQQVQITFDAFPGYTFEGSVLEVPLQGTLSQSIVTYAVPISLEGVEGVDLKAGMTANLTIVTGHSESALLIPALAVLQGDSGTVVQVQNADGTTTQTPVELGLANGTYAEVLRGLNEGDQVVVTYDTSEDEEMFGFGPQFRQEMLNGERGAIVVTEGGGPPPGAGIP